MYVCMYVCMYVHYNTQPPGEKVYVWVGFIGYKDWEGSGDFNVYVHVSRSFFDLCHHYLKLGNLKVSATQGQ